MNALIAAGGLSFGERGLTVVYGDNGSGRSGYARLIKSAVRSLHSEPVHGDVFGTDPDGPQEAQINYRSGGEERPPSKWPDGVSGVLGAVSFYDEACGEVYLTKESELAGARRDRSIDWIVVCMHEVAMSTAAQPKANGADIGIRREWMPLFDRYGVDLVVCGNEHHYERTQPVRGTTGSETLTPQPVAASPQVIDTSQGTVQMVIGGGGTSVTSNQLLTDPPVCGVITSVGPEREAGRGSLQGGFLVSHYAHEEAIWSSVRDKDHPYGFAAFTVDPGRRRGGQTSIEVTYYRVVGLGGELEAYDSFTLVRPRSDR